MTDWIASLSGGELSSKGGGSGAAAARSTGVDGSSVDPGGVMRDQDGCGSSAAAASAAATPKRGASRFQKGDGGAGGSDRSATGGASPSFWDFIFIKLGRSMPSRSADMRADGVPMARRSS